jgi:hypothetical protein
MLDPACPQRGETKQEECRCSVVNWQGPASYTKGRPVLSSERAPHKNKTEIIVMNVHAPTEDKIDDIKDRFYEELEHVFEYPTSSTDVQS